MATTARDIVNGAIRHFGMAGIDASGLSATTTTAGTVVIDALRMIGISTYDVSSADAATATMASVVIKAFRDLNLIGIDETPDAAESADALAAFNEMQAGWLMDGVDVSAADVALTDTFPLAKSLQIGVTAMLSAKIAESYGAALPPQIAASAQRCWAALQAAYVTVPHALAALNNMLASWASQGVDAGYSAALTLSSTLPLKDDFVGGAKALLALRLAEALEKKPPQSAVMDAERGWQMLRIAYQITPNALTALNDMIFSWEGDGVDVDHTAYTLSSNFALGDKYVAGVKAMLAVRMASEFGIQITPQVAASAQRCWEALQAEYITAPDASFDNAIVYMPSQRLTGIDV